MTGNPDAEYQLYQLYSGALYNTCLRMLRYVPEAEDMLQETFIKIFKNLKSFKLDSNFYTWTNRIAINSCINHQSKKGIDYTMDYEHEVAMKAADEEYNEDEIEYSVEMVNRGIMNLPNGYREIISLYLLEGYDHKEIGEILGISNSTSKSQYARAKKKLKELLSAQAHG
ncbi:MAG: RNA polymerase [Bacteroidetes bacterium]|nr:MAG: RNA polymerase [Bacteroidota bacterium]